MSIAAAFSPLVGHERPKTLLSRAVSQAKIAPAYLFAGPEGVGRSLAARCFAQLIFAPVAQGWEPGELQRLAHRIAQGNHPDLLWVEPTYLHQGKTFTVRESEQLGLKRKTAPQVRLSQIRDVARFVSRPPLEASRSLVVIEQAETMAEAAANGLLKTLEEPGQATLILLAPSSEALLPTLVSRSQTLLFTALSNAQVRKVLELVGQDELLTDPSVLALAEGSPGRSIALWERLKSMPEEIMVALADLPRWGLGKAGTLKEALALASLISGELDLSAQVWLMNYLQYQLWLDCAGDRGQPLSSDNRHLAANHLKMLEDSRQMLLRYVQPLLVWEVLLLGFVSTQQTPAQIRRLARFEPF